MLCPLRGDRAWVGLDSLRPCSDCASNIRSSVKIIAYRLPPAVVPDVMRAATAAVAGARTDAPSTNLDGAIRLAF